MIHWYIGFQGHMIYESIVIHGVNNWRVTVK